MAGNIEQIEWYLAREGQQFGPLSDSELKKIIDLGHLKSDDLLWRDGMEEWEKSEKIFPPPAPPKPIFSAPPKPVFKDPNAPDPEEPSHGESSDDAPSSQAQTNDQAETSTGTAEPTADLASTETSDGKIADADAADKAVDETEVESVEDILESIALDGDRRPGADAKTEDAETDQGVGETKNTGNGAEKVQSEQPANAVKDDTTAPVTADDGSAATGDSAQDDASAHSEQSGDVSADKRGEKADEPNSKSKSRFKLTSKPKAKVASKSDQDLDREIAQGDNTAAQDRLQSADGSKSSAKAPTTDKATAKTVTKADDNPDTKIILDVERSAEADQSGDDVATEDSVTAKTSAQSAADINKTGDKAGDKTNDIAGGEIDQLDASASPETQKSRFSFARSLSIFRGKGPASTDSKKAGKTTSSNNDATEPQRASDTDKSQIKKSSKSKRLSKGTSKVAATKAAAAPETPAKKRHFETPLQDQNPTVDIAAADKKNHSQLHSQIHSVAALNKASKDAAKTSPDDPDQAAKLGKVENNGIKKTATKRTERDSKSADVTGLQSSASRQHGAQNTQRPRPANISRQDSRPAQDARPAIVSTAESRSATSVSSGLVSAGTALNRAPSTQRTTSAKHGRNAGPVNQASQSPKGHQRNTSDHGQLVGHRRPTDPQDARGTPHGQNARLQGRRPQHGDPHRAPSAAAAATPVAATIARHQNGTTSRAATHGQTPANAHPAHGTHGHKAAPVPVLNSIAVRQASGIPTSPAELTASAPAPTPAPVPAASRHTPPAGQIAREPGTHRNAAASRTAPGQAAQRMAAPPYIAGTSQTGQGSVGALPEPEPKRKRRRVMLPLLLASAIGGAGWLSYTGRIEIPSQIKPYYTKAVSIGKSLAASYIPNSSNKPGNADAKSTAAPVSGQAQMAKKSLQVVLNKQITPPQPQLAVPKIVTLPSAPNPVSGSATTGTAGTGQIVTLPVGQIPSSTSSPNAAQAATDISAANGSSGLTQITRQIPTAPIPAQPPGPPQNPLLSSPLWRYIEQEFPNWYNKRASEAMTLKEDNLDDHAIIRLMDQKMIALRRRYASTALASSQPHLKQIAASFLAMVKELSKHSVSACYGFISHGESAPQVSKLLQNQNYSQYLDAQSLAIVKAVIDGRNLPQTHKPPEPEDYRALAAELTKRGWSTSDLQLFTDPVALSNAKPAKVCSMVQDWFAAQLALPNSAAQLRLLVQSLRPVIAG